MTTNGTGSTADAHTAIMNGSGMRNKPAKVITLCGSILFNNQFTPDEVYDNYPADRLMHDIALALMATQTQTTEVLDTFPTIPAVQEAEQILAEAENPEVTIPQEA